MKTPISPKVIVAVVVGILLTSVVSNISAITPDMFDFLGAWKLFWFGTFITTLIGLAAFWKTDPLRILPADVKADQEAAAAAQAAKQTSVAATTADTTAPASTFPKAAVDAALAAEPVAPVEPVTVTPVFTPPAA